MVTLDEHVVVTDDFDKSSFCGIGWWRMLTGVTCRDNKESGMRDGAHG